MATSTTRSRNPAIAASSSGSTSSTSSEPAPSSAMTASASPTRSAWARAPMCAPKRWVVSRAVTGRVGRALEAGDEVGEHGTGLDRRQLVGVADQHQPGVGAHRLEQPGHHRQRDHRGLVDDDHVVGQPVGAVVAEPDAAVGSPAQQPVQRRGLQARQAVAVGGVRQAGRRLPHGLLQPGGRLAGRGGQGDPGCAALESSCCSATRASMPATVVVLPVPGPPVRTVVHARAPPPAPRRAARRSPRAGRPAAQARSSRAASSTSGGVRRIRATRSSQT